MSKLIEKMQEFKDRGGNFSLLAREVGVSATYVSKAYDGWTNFKLSDKKKREVEKKILDYLALRFEVKKSVAKNISSYSELCKQVDILEFDNTINIFASIYKAVKQRALMHITAKSGTGKTTALYAMRHKIPQMVLITAYDGMYAKELLEEVLYELGVKTLPKNVKDLMREIKRTLKNAKRVIVIDEANFITERSLEQLRHIHDVCDVAMIFVGTEKLEYTIARSHEQVESRIRKSLPLRVFNETEVMMLAKKMDVVCSNDIAKKVWRKCRNLREVEYLFEDCVEKNTTIEEEL